MITKNGVFVRVRHGGTEVEFEGEIGEVWAAVNKYFSQNLGPIELISKLTGSVDVTMLAQKLVDKTVIRKDEISVLQQGDAKKRIILCLSAAYVGKRLGLIEEDCLQPKKIAAYLHMDEKVVRARLSELWKEGVVDRDVEGRYSINPVTALKLLE